jgi:DNA-directed RNA polymerase subunit RPC12/RpoP
MPEIGRWGWRTRESDGTYQHICVDCSATYVPLADTLVLPFDNHAGHDTYCDGCGCQIVYNQRSGMERRADDADWEWIGRRCNKVGYPDDRRQSEVDQAGKRRIGIGNRREVFSRRVRVGGGDRRNGDTKRV